MSLILFSCAGWALLGSLTKCCLRVMGVSVLSLVAATWPPPANFPEIAGPWTWSLTFYSFWSPSRRSKQRPLPRWKKDSFGPTGLGKRPLSKDLDLVLRRNSRLLSAFIQQNAAVYSSIPNPLSKGTPRAVSPSSTILYQATADMGGSRETHGRTAGAQRLLSTLRRGTSSGRAAIPHKA